MENYIMKVHSCFSTGRVGKTFDMKLPFIPQIGMTIKPHKNVPFAGKFGIKVEDVLISMNGQIEIFCKNGYAGHSLDG